jgi:hypothetical protein
MHFESIILNNETILRLSYNNISLICRKKTMKNIFIILFLLFCSFGLSSQQLNLLPPVPEPATNPHLSTAFNGVKTGNTTFLKSFAEAEEILLAALAYLHPSSPYKNQQAVLDRLIFFLDIILTGWDDGTMALNDMQFCFQANVSYLMLKQHAPSAIPAARKEIWESGIRKNIAAILKAKPDMYDKHIVGSIWLNGDVRLVLGVYFGGITLNDPGATEKARIVLEEVMPRTLLGDGGTHYVGYANESPSYHGEATIRPFAWYYIFTGSQKVREFITDTDKYIPLVNIPVGEGFKEWSTSPAWKPYYNRVSLKPEALAKAYLSGDPFNFEVGKGSQLLFQVFMYRSGLTGISLPDNYMLYDKNSLGPRGRYGNWGVVGTLRDPSIPGPELTEDRYLHMDGNNTFVGTFTLNASASATTYPLNAAMQGTAPQVKFATGAETDWSRGNKWAYLTGKDRKDAISRTKTVYGMSTSYLISKKRFAELPWMARQQWVVTPDRVIGMCEAEATTSNGVYGFAHRIQLVSGRRNASGTRKMLSTSDFNNYSYGDLRLKIHEKTYEGKVDTFYHGVMNDPLDKFSVMIELHDQQSGNDQLVNYVAGTKRHVILESTNKDRAYATQVSKLTLPQGLSGFEFTEGNTRKVRIVHNISASAVTMSAHSLATSFGKVRIIRSWNDTQNEIIHVNDGSATVASILIPAHGHVLFICSDNSDDMGEGFDTYETVFKKSVSATTIQPKHGLNDLITVIDGRLLIFRNITHPNLTVSVHTTEGKLISKTRVDVSEQNQQIALNYRGPLIVTLGNEFNKTILSGKLLL